VKEDLTTGGFQMVKSRAQKDQGSHPAPFSEAKGPRITRGAQRGGRGDRGGFRGDYHGNDRGGFYRGGRGGRNYESQHYHQDDKREEDRTQE
jgi:hypothetical protein